MVREREGAQDRSRQPTQLKACLGRRVRSTSTRVGSLFAVVPPPASVALGVTRGVTRRFYSRSWAVCARAFRAGRAGLRGEGRPRGFLPSSGGYGERERGRAKLRGGLSHRRFPEEAGVLPQPDPILVGAYISDSTGARRKRRGRGVSVGEGACGGREGRARHVGAAQHASWQRRRTWRIAQAGEALQSGGG